MRLIPKDKVGKIEFCEGRAKHWAERAEAIGLTPEDVAQLQALTEAARAAHNRQYQAQRAAQGATAALNDAIEKMTGTATKMISRIRGHAGGGRNDVYVQAMVWPRAKNSPIAPPGTPYGFKVELCATGAITLTWKCRNPRGAQGTIYHLWRRVDGGKRAYVGWAGERKFTDDTLPRGATSVVYEINAERSTVKGPVATFNVNFGTDGKMPVSIITRSQRPPMAA